MRFRALTFNMQNGQGWSNSDPDNTPVQLEATLAFLRDQDADVVFLQEVEIGYDGGRQIEPPPHFGWLQTHLPEYHAVFDYPRINPEELPFGLGQAIFSKTPLTNKRRIDLPPPSLTFEFGGMTRSPSHRLLIGADSHIAGHPITLWNTHLQAFFMIDASSNDHPAQRNRVETELRSSEGAVLIGGDFNSSPDESLVDQFAKAGFQTAQNSKITWRRMPFILDHLFFNSSLKRESCEVIATDTSDHFAVRAEFSFVS